MLEIIVPPTRAQIDAGQGAFVQPQSCTMYLNEGAMVFDADYQGNLIATVTFESRGAHFSIQAPVADSAVRGLANIKTGAIQPQVGMKLAISGVKLDASRSQDKQFAFSFILVETPEGRQANEARQQIFKRGPSPVKVGDIQAFQKAAQETRARQQAPATQAGLSDEQFDTLLKQAATRGYEAGLARAQSLAEATEDRAVRAETNDSDHDLGGDEPPFVEAEVVANATINNTEVPDKNAYKAKGKPRKGDKPPKT